MLQASRQKCKRLDEPFDVRIGALLVAQFQTLGNLWVAFRKDAAHLAQVGQLGFVIPEKFFLAIRYHEFQLCRSYC